MTNEYVVINNIYGKFLMSNFLLTLRNCIMNKILLASLMVGGAFLMSAPVNAQDNVGCGLGAMAWKGESSRAANILAATTNVSFGTQTFGITSGTSGCEQSGRISGGTGRMGLAFIENNMEQFAMDASAGHGETIDTLAGIMNVDSEKLGQISKENFALIFPNEDVDAVYVTLTMLDLTNNS